MFFLFLVFVWSFLKFCFVFVSQRFEKKYNMELAKGAVSKDTKFEYAWCLIRSKYTNDIKQGIQLLEGEYKLWLISTIILLNYIK